MTVVHKIIRIIGGTGTAKTACGRTIDLIDHPVNRPVDCKVCQSARH